MEDKTTYSVFWRSTCNKEWNQFSPWFESYSDAYDLLTRLFNNPGCLEAAVVERTETFDFIARMEKKDGN